MHKRHSLKVLVLLFALYPYCLIVQADLHFKPADHALGDVHPFFCEGECFLFQR